MLKNKFFVFTALVVVSLVLAVSGCVTAKPKLTKDNFKNPKISLDHVEVAHYWGWWYYSKKVKPTKGKPDNRGAPFILAFVFNITNPNDYPVELDGLRFTIAFEEFDLNTVNTYETMWIPAGKTNQVRVCAAFDARTTLLSLGVTGGFKLKAKGMSLFGQLEKWWKGIGEFSFPIYVKEGAASFEADGVSTVISFSEKFPE